MNGETEIIETVATGRAEGLDIGVRRPPAMVLEEARRAAKALKDIVDAKPKPVMFNGERYLEFEDWQTVGRFYGISPRVTSTRYVEYGDVRGWEALAEAVHVPSGSVISMAEAMCLNDEEKWHMRPKYEYHYVKKSGGLSSEDPGRDELIWEEKNGKRFPKKERVRMGDERVPLFQLRSMAQTRAGAKALRNALAWVVVLAGYKPTPAEELPRQDDPEGGEHEPEPVVAKRADGSALVTGVDPKTAKNGKPWYLVTFDDGRSGSTFDTKLAGQAEAAQKAGTLVIPTLEQRGQYWNLIGLGPVGTAPAGNGHGQPAGEAIINENQLRRFHAIATGHGWSEAEQHELLSANGYTSSKAIKVADYERLVDQLKARPK